MKKIADFLNKNRNLLLWGALIVIILLAAFLRLYRLGTRSLVADEYLSMRATYGYHQTGEWKVWDFNQEKLTDEKYTRGKVYYWQVAQLFHFLEPTEANSRLVSVGWGILGVILIFLVSYYYTRKFPLALLAALLAAISLSNLLQDRNFRMYSMFAPVFFLFSLSIFQFLESKPGGRAPVFLKKLRQKTYFNWLYLIPVMAFGWLSLETHLLTVNIVLVLLIYFFISGLFLSKKSNLSHLWYGLGLTAIILIALFAKLPYLNKAASFLTFPENNWSYLLKTTWDYSHLLVAFTFIMVGASYLIRKYPKIGTWLTVNYLTILLAAILLWDRNAGDQYLYLSQPFKIILVAGGIYYSANFLAQKIGFKFQSLTALLLTGYFFIILINWGFLASGESFYGEPKDWDHPNYREAYGEFLKRRQPEDVLITRELYLYNIRGSHSKTFSYGEDDKLRLEEIQRLQQENSRVWFITSDKEFNVKGSAEDYIEENFQLVENKHTNNKVLIWLWPPQEESN